MRLISSLFALMLAVASQAAPLKCNYSSADISVKDDEHVMFAGFAARTKLSTGTHLPLRTHCLVITDGQEKICIISNDLMETSPVLADQLRDRISIATGLDRDNILFHNIHTHSAPRMMGKWSVPGAPNYIYALRTADAIVANAVKTITDEKAFQKFSLEIGSTSTYFQGNRCEKDGPVDHDVYAARLIGRRGKPICAFINLGCHPVCMGPKSLLQSSDYSGVARNIIREKWGCEVFQFTGAAGNIDPAEGPKTFEYAEQCGKALAADLEKVVFKRVEDCGTLLKYKNVSHLPYSIPEVTKEAVHRLADSISVSYKTEFPRFADDVRGWENQIISEWDNPGKNYKSLDYDMTALNVNGVVFFFTQGEPFCEYQMDARKAFPGKTIFFCAYTNGQNAYLASERGYQVRKGYEYELEQMFVYIKSPYPLSDKMPETYSNSIRQTIEKVLQ